MTLRSESSRDGRRGRGPFVRRRDLPPDPAAPGGPSRPTGRTTECLVRNDTGAARQQYEVLRLAGPLISPEDNAEHYLAHDLFAGAAVAGEGELRLCVLQQPAAEDAIRLAVYAGATVVRLTGPTGRTHAVPVAGAFALEAADAGPVVILHDPGPSVGDPAEAERFAKVRIGGGGAGPAIVMFQIDGVDEYCESVLATVLQAGCDVEAPTSIRVYDRAGCFFNVPPEHLPGAVGFAAKMDATDLYETCEWVVIHLCCLLEG